MTGRNEGFPMTGPAAQTAGIVPPVQYRVIGRFIH